MSTPEHERIIVHTATSSEAGSRKPGRNLPIPDRAALVNDQS